MASGSSPVLHSSFALARLLGGDPEPEEASTEQDQATTWASPKQDLCHATSSASSGRGGKGLGGKIYVGTLGR